VLERDKAGHLAVFADDLQLAAALRLPGGCILGIQNDENIEQTQSHHGGNRETGFHSNLLLEFLQEERWNPEFLQGKSAVSNQHSVPSQTSNTEERRKWKRPGIQNLVEDSDYG
jgi:hypothetical protein